MIWDGLASVLGEDEPSDAATLAEPRIKHRPTTGFANHRNRPKLRIANLRAPSATRSASSQLALSRVSH
jgi:hypothetical protein